MAVITSVTYRFCVNGEFTEIMEAKRGIRQGDPISPLLFVIMMEYMNRIMSRLQQNLGFKHHSKCARIGLTHLTFADDVLLFSRGDYQSIELLLTAFREFSESTGLVVNPHKCKMFCSGMDEDTVKRIKSLSGFSSGSLPVRYLGIPLTSKKLSIAQYLPLIERIVGKIRHWTTKLLSTAGRIQLVKSVTTAVAQYWMSCFPIPKGVLHKIDAICRAFIWAGKEESKKSPMAWKIVCTPVRKGGLNIINLDVWNQIAVLKCLWNISMKRDNLWVRWVHAYFLKKKSLHDAQVNSNTTWMLKAIMGAREKICCYQPLWDQMMATNNFNMKKMYDKAMILTDEVNWKHLIQRNYARPRAVLYLWLSCHGRLATKARLKRFGFIHDDVCALCNLAVENIGHLLFECSKTSMIWKEVLNWLGINRQPQCWDLELEWLKSSTKSKSNSAGILKIAITETIYELWSYRNAVIFGNSTDNRIQAKNIIDVIVYRGWAHHKYRKSIAMLFM
ncbi:uncharacterized protein LOC131604785 [Vicia villosa]|uniref:uncharacterized protein LOC131604785 n=1 Tax=Vicia villosa TaxID=3911 RepID=UPI00273B8E95|nr:uncharacterized protein LOC131604785 [Vicia villosa]